MKESFEKIYHEIEKKHFWFKSRRKYIVGLLKKYPRHISILDIGCSSGILLHELAECGFDSSELYGIDISENAIQNCKNNGLENTFVMDAQSIQLNKKFDVLIASDCLEHLKNDTKALENWYGLLKQDGVLLVFVPAFMLLWSDHDVANMHFRRYTKTDLKKKLTDRGFKIDKSGYWNFFLFVPILCVRILGNLRKSNKKSSSGDLNKPSLFNGLLFQLINFENKLLSFINFPFGVSTFCIAKKSTPARKSLT